MFTVACIVRRSRLRIFIHITNKVTHNFIPITDSLFTKVLEIIIYQCSNEKNNLHVSFFFLKVSPLGQRFNKGRLFNTAIQYLQKQTLNITCIILHDVDLIPEDDGNYYSCESTRPKHTTSRVRQLNNPKGYTRYYEFLIGGVLLLTFDMYKTLNGFSNLYWGWGGEDDDLALRLIQRRMCVVRPNYELAIYVGQKQDISFRYFFIFIIL
jgi:hypothetical protein